MKAKYVNGKVLYKPERSTQWFELQDLMNVLIDYKRN